MQGLIAALRAAKPAQLPQLGLRLANSLVGPKPSQQFWKEYVRTVSDRDVFSRLSPHSKCLLTCVACRLDHGVARTSQADQLVQRVFKDVVSPKSLCLVNLELINMLLVACYTLRVPMSTQQMEHILDRGLQLVEQNSYFNVEFSVSLLHSLGAVARAYPRLRQQTASSDLVRSMVANFATFSHNLNMRELSLVLYAFDKLQVYDDQLASAIVQLVMEKRSEIEGQNLATILFACSSHPGTAEVLSMLRENVRKAAGQVTGREACNICCAYLRADMWDDSLFSLLGPGVLAKMNAQELCNVVNLMMHKNVVPTDSFKDSYVDHINANIGTLKPSLLDALTLTQSFSCWNLANRMDRRKVDRGLSMCITSDGSSLCSKHVYLLHYCVSIGCRQAAASAVKLIASQLPEEQATLNNKEIVILYNSMRNIGTDKEYLLKVDGILKQRLSKHEQRFSDIDMHTLAHWGDATMLTLIAKRCFGSKWDVNYKNIKLLSAIVKVVHNDETVELARDTIGRILMSPDKTQGGPIIGQNMTASIDSDYGYVKSEMRYDSRTVVAACELLPSMQGKMDVVTIFGNALFRLSIEYGFRNIDAKLLVALLSVARKLNVQSKDITVIANIVAERLVDSDVDTNNDNNNISHLEYLEYLNAVYRLEIEVTNQHRVVKCAKRMIMATREDRVKEAIVLALASMCFSGSIHAKSLTPLISCVLTPKPTHMLEKAIMLYLQANGPITVRLFDGLKGMLVQGALDGSSVHRQPTSAATNLTSSPTMDGCDLNSPITEDHNQVQDSVYATLQRIVGQDANRRLMRAEAAMAFDYIADILLTRR